MKRAILNLSVKPSKVIIDGNKVPDMSDYVKFINLILWKMVVIGRGTWIIYLLGRRRPSWRKGYIFTTLFSSRSSSPIATSIASKISMLGRGRMIISVLIWWWVTSSTSRIYLPSKTRRRIIISIKYRDLFY